MKKPAPKKPKVARTTSSNSKKPMSTTSAKASVKKRYVEEPFRMTPKQAKEYGKLLMSPKTSATIFTLPKGANKLPQTEKDAIQRRRTLDRQRTLARAKAIIRRTP